MADPNDLPDPRALRARLAREIDLVPWSELRSHAVANRMLLVASELELLEVAVAVATDDAARIEAWIGGGQLARPALEQMQAWERAGRARFRCVITAPFVLTQEHPAGE